MNCLEFRQLKLSDPYAVVPEANAHRDTCAHCTRFEEQINTLDRRIDEALAVTVPENLAAKVLLNQSLRDKPTRPTRLYWLGLAASFLVAAAIFIVQPDTASALPGKIADHLDHEQRIVGAAHEPIDEVQVQDVLDEAGFAIESLPGDFVYARTCVLDGMLAAHLVIEENGSRFTVMVMPTQSSSLSFEEGRWRGVISSTPVGSFAVVAGTDVPRATVQNVADKYLALVSANRRG